MVCAKNAKIKHLGATMKLDEFTRALKANDFAIGDSFWLCGIGFEVYGKKTKGIGNSYFKEE